jgi:hypothetical protein
MAILTSMSKFQWSRVFPLNLSLIAKTFLAPIENFTILTSMTVTNDGYNEQIITVLTIFAIT